MKKPVDWFYSHYDISEEERIELTEAMAKSFDCLDWRNEGRCTGCSMDVKALLCGDAYFSDKENAAVFAKVAEILARRLK